MKSSSSRGVSGANPGADHQSRKQFLVLAGQHARFDQRRGVERDYFGLHPELMMIEQMLA